MAQVLQITNGTNTVSLLGTIKIKPDGWTELHVVDQNGLVWQTFECYIKATDANIRAEVLKLDKLLRQAKDFVGDPTEGNEVFLRMGSDGENVRRTLVYEGAHEIGSQSTLLPLLGGKGVIPFKLTVAHAPWWEEESERTTTTAGVSTLGASIVWGGVNYGSVPARISYLSLGSTATTLQKFWIGIRRLREGSVGFNSIIGFNAVTFGADTSSVVDATARLGSKAQTTFAVISSLVYRCEGSVASGGAMWGRYLVLCRMKLNGAATEVGVQLRYGNNGTWRENQEIYLSAVSDPNILNWNLIELGQCEIGGGTGIGSGVLPSSLSVYAERISAAGTMDIDTFVLIPLDAYAYVDTGYGLLLADTASINSDSHGHHWVTIWGSVTTQVADLSIQENPPFEWPAMTGGIMVIAAQGPTSHVLSETITVTMHVYPRTYSYRTS